MHHLTISSNPYLTPGAVHGKNLKAPNPLWHCYSQRLLVCRGTGSSTDLVLFRIIRASDHILHPRTHLMQPNYRSIQLLILTISSEIEPNLHTMKPHCVLASKRFWLLFIPLDLSVKLFAACHATPSCYKFCQHNLYSTSQDPGMYCTNTRPNPPHSLAAADAFKLSQSIFSSDQSLPHLPTLSDSVAIRTHHS